MNSSEEAVCHYLNVSHKTANISFLHVRPAFLTEKINPTEEWDGQVILH